MGICLFCTLYINVGLVQSVSENGSSGEGGTVEVVLVEARDLKAADWGGTSDPYVSARYGNIKKRTKVS